MANKCKKCDNEQFFSRYNRKTKDREAYVCSKCGMETPVKNENKGSSKPDNNEVK